MQVHDLLRLYQSKSDEELLQLAVAPGDLTSEAQLALQSELSRRQISLTSVADAPQEGGNRHDAARITASERPIAEGPQGVADFVAEVLRAYHRDFWLFFKITAPAVIIGTAAFIMRRNQVREIDRLLARGVDVLAYRTQILEIWLVNFSAYFVSWMVFCFSFAAICIAVEEVAAGFAPSATHSLLSVRERLGSLLRLSLLLFVLAVAGVAAAGLLEIGVLWTLHHWIEHLSHSLIWGVTYVSMGLLLLVLLRFALAVPALILDDYKVGQAIFRSDELTRGKWLTLATLLAKSIVGGYVAGMCPFWLVSLLHVTGPMPSWLPWLLTVASVLGVTVAEPPMFLGFALLYLKTSASDSAPGKALTSQLA